MPLSPWVRFGGSSPVELNCDTSCTQTNVSLPSCSSMRMILQVNQPHIECISSCVTLPDLAAAWKADTSPRRSPLVWISRDIRVSVPLLLGPAAENGSGRRQSVSLSGLRRCPPLPQGFRRLPPFPLSSRSLLAYEAVWALECLDLHEVRSIAGRSKLTFQTLYSCPEAICHLRALQGHERFGSPSANYSETLHP